MIKPFMAGVTILLCMVELICYMGFEPDPALRITTMTWGADSYSAAELTFASDNYHYIIRDSDHSISSVSQLVS